jgi:hypothetical protein
MQLIGSVGGVAGKWQDSSADQYSSADEDRLKTCRDSCNGNYLSVRHALPFGLAETQSLER